MKNISRFLIKECKTLLAAASINLFKMSVEGYFKNV